MVPAAGVSEPRFDQPFGAVYQVAYTVQDLAAAMARFSARLQVAPWFTFEFRASPLARHRGRPTSLRLAIARGFSGHLNIELVQQLDDGPSIFRESVERQGHGFHHWGIRTAAFDREVATYAGLGLAPALFDQGPYGNRIAFFDTTGLLPGMVEIVETSPVHEESLQRMYRQSLAFDGTDPVRPNP
jgi:hypothetical protein